MMFVIFNVMLVTDISHNVLKYIFFNQIYIILGDPEYLGQG